MSKVLVVSSLKDAHARNMCEVLNNRGVPNSLFSTDKYPYGSQITIVNESVVLRFNGKIIELTEDWSIWDRRIFPPEFPKGFPPNLEEMVEEEAKRTIQGVMAIHRGLVVNNPFSNNAANNKIEQLQRARKIGLRVPDSLVTNDPEKARKFYKKHKGNIVFKLQKLPIVEEDGTYKTIFTNRVTPKDFAANLPRVSNNPCYFQEHIRKAYEIRLTVIGERLFPIAIHSQGSDVSKDDFRRYDFKNVRYEAVDIPDGIRDKILELTRQYELHYAAIDLIHTPAGEYIFLEVNPNGQYLWTEELSKVKITDTFIDYLSGKVESRRFVHK